MEFHINEQPFVFREFLMYMQSIKGKSIKRKATTKKVAEPVVEEAQKVEIVETPVEDEAPKKAKRPNRGASKSKAKTSKKTKNEEVSE